MALALMCVQHFDNWQLCYLICHLHLDSQFHLRCLLATTANVLSDIKCILHTAHNGKVSHQKLKMQLANANDQKSDTISIYLNIWKFFFVAKIPIKPDHTTLQRASKALKSVQNIGENDCFDRIFQNCSFLSVFFSPSFWYSTTEHVQRWMKSKRITRRCVCNWHHIKNREN